tara:strand:+ start:1219 stop:2175 length:957 start_codon:yes stop_codon:yes gene_type:complete
MANANQGNRSGNAFGHVANITNFPHYTEGIKLEPGYLIRLRSRMHLIAAVEPMVVDLFFSDTVNVGNASAGTLNGTDSTPLMQYGGQSIQAYYDITDSDAAANLVGNILKPDYDSGHISFDDLEPFKGNLYQLCPTLPLQPKFMVLDTGDWHSLSDASPNEGGTPIGFKGDGTVANTQHVGTVSGKIYMKHPAGIPRNILDEAPSGESGTARTETNLEGLSGFIDGSVSSPEAPNWDYSIFVEHGENNLPTFRYVNDSDEYILDGRIRLIGWKYRIIELSQEQVNTFKQRSGGRLRFKIINTTGLPVEGSMLADYFPK